jgi:hypothetical protein
LDDVIEWDERNYGVEEDEDHKLVEILQYRKKTISNPAENMITQKAGLLRIFNNWDI